MFLRGFSRFRSILLASTSIVVIAAPARAQDAIVLDPITVTAEKVEQNAQEVPASLTVISRDVKKETMVEEVLAAIAATKPGT